MYKTSASGFFASVTLERFCFYLMCVLSAVPLLFSHYPPMVDIPQHAAQVSTLNHLLFSSDYAYRDLFQINWGIPYWGAYLPLLLLSYYLPILLSVKLILAAAIIATPITVSKLRSHFEHDPAIDWLSLPIIFGFAFQWGFLNFLIGVPIVLTFLLFVFRYAIKPTLSMGIALTFFTLFLLFMHLLIMGFGCGIAVIYILASNPHWKKKLIAILPFLCGPLIGLTWLVFIISTSAQHNEPGPWALSFMRPFELLASAIGQPFKVTTVILGGFIFVLPFLLGFRITTHKPRIFIFLALLFWMMFGPNYFMGNYYTYNRFAVFVIPLFLLLLTPPKNGASRYQQLGRTLLFTLPMMLILDHCFRFASFELESKGYRQIYSQMKPEQRALMLIFNRNSDAYDTPQFLHLPAWYQAESGGMVEFSFAAFGIQASFKPDTDLGTTRGFEWYPQDFNWYANKGWLFDYFVVKHPENLGKYLFRNTNCPVKLVANSGEWWLYENDKTQCVALTLK